MRPHTGSMPFVPRALLVEAKMSEPLFGRRSFTKTAQTNCRDALSTGPRQSARAKWTRRKPAPVLQVYHVIPAPGRNFVPVVAESSVAEEGAVRPPRRAPLRRSRMAALISTSSAKSRSSRTAAARCCELPQAPRSIPYAAPTRLPGDPARARTSLIVWCLKRPMARKPLMHNYIYFETFEVGPDSHPPSPSPPIARFCTAKNRRRHRRPWNGKSQN